MRRATATFDQLVKYIESGWFPLWIGFDDSTPTADHVIAVDWVCRWRVPDGKFFCTESRCSPDEVEHFRVKAKQVWCEQMDRQFNVEPIKMDGVE